MQATIVSYSDYKKNEYGPSAKFKLSNGEQVYINEEPAPLVGKTVDIETKDKDNRAGTRTYKVGKILKVYEATATTAANAANGNSNGKITWDAYRAMAEAAHELAIKLEPDSVAPHIDGDDHGYHTTVDRSQARASIVNTTLSRYCEGKIFVPADEDDIPPF